MQSFRTPDNAVWDIELTPLLARTLRSRADLSVYHLFDEGEISKLGDESIALDVIWTCIEFQANERKVSFDQFFGEIADSETIDQATEAFLRAVVEFLPEKKRIKVAPVVDAILSGVEKAQGAASKRLESLDPQAIEKAIVDKLTSGWTSSEES